MSKKMNPTQVDSLLGCACSFIVMAGASVSDVREAMERFLANDAMWKHMLPITEATAASIAGATDEKKDGEN